MTYNLFTTVLILFYSFTAPVPTTNFPDTKNNPEEIITTEAVSAEANVQSVYSQLNAKTFQLPDLESFSKAFKGYYQLKEKGIIKKNILTLIDFTKSSNTKRLWIIDMNTKTVLYNTLVSHGRNSGNEFATDFSNTSSSNKSSLGFYATGELYTGKHGTSLRLDGLEPGINCNARNRAIVIHAADYVSENFIKQHSRLGRSQGCPALPKELNKEIIDLIKEKSCLFIYHPSKNYTQKSKLLS